MKFSKPFILILTLVLFAIPLLAQTSSSYATTPCSLASLKGAYAGTLEGTVIAQLPNFPPPPQPLVESTFHVYDGAGNVSAKATVSIGGVVFPTTATGTYTVTSDCNYTHVLKSTSGLVAKAVGVIRGTGSSREVQEIWTLPWAVVSATLRRIPEGGCSLETVKGAYTVFGQGFLTPPGASTLVPANHVGIFAADGHGNFEGEDTLQIANQTMADTFTATLTVNPDCTALAHISTSLGLVDEVGTWTGPGKSLEWHGIVVTPGWVLAETVKKQ